MEKKYLFKLEYKKKFVVIVLRVKKEFPRIDPRVTAQVRTRPLPTCISKIPSRHLCSPVTEMLIASVV
jgi:hypothetical protein